MAAALLAGDGARAADAPSRPIDFNREIRPILSNACFSCHGPDAKKRKGVSQPLRLDTEAGAFADLGGYASIVRGKPEESELIQRIISDDSTEVMPPPSSAGKRLTPREIELLTEWVRQGAPYARHWSYVKPSRPPLPDVGRPDWARNAIDRFILARLEREGLAPSPEADRAALVRRLSLDLTGLPPSLGDVDEFVRDEAPDAYERLVDRLLARPSYGEHWARMWLDLARYADSAGYADDPPRTIWAYRDYVIRSFNANKPFDKFTIEQIAGDLLPNPTEEQLVATAFHRNTLTNNEGGTSDEEFRSVAVVDRVNTTLAVWMGTTMACAQCHDHKYDPLTQEEYFRLYAFFNNTEDADRKDESPLISLFGDSQKRRRSGLEDEAAKLQKVLDTPTPELEAGQRRWEAVFASDLAWTPLEPTPRTARDGAKPLTPEGGSTAGRVQDNGKGISQVLTFAVDGRRLSALRLEGQRSPANSVDPKGRLVVSGVRATIAPPAGVGRPAGRYVRVELPGKEKILSLAEIQAFSGPENVARGGEATQSSTAFDGPAARAIDGNTDGRYEEAKSTTHTETSDDPWWEVDLKSTRPIDRVVVWNRTDGNLESRLAGARVVLLDDRREPVWTKALDSVPKPSLALETAGPRELRFVAAFEDGSRVAGVVDGKPGRANPGWVIAGPPGTSHYLTLALAEPIAVEPGSTLSLTIDQPGRAPALAPGVFRVAASGDDRAGEAARTPDAILGILGTPPDRRTDAQRAELARYYRATVAPELKATRDRLASLKAQLAAIQPETTVPIQRDLPPGSRRKTQVQRRGNFLDLAQEVTEGVPAAFQPLPEGARPDRLALARWLVADDNPLTARVIVNRCWEQVFGVPLVPTSEDFGAQGELPTHPELLDWLATELVAERWDLKQFLRLLVTSAAYRQDSRVTPELARRDPDNQLLTRGPRYRLSAETIRDQALAVGGLLSPTLYGPPVKPPQPTSGLTAAFGSGIDWQTSQGADRYRRGLYTTWRRSNPYPSMATFDAPNREVCTLRRSRTNTPLQALVTLNDPAYVEAAQALARRVAAGGGTVAEKARLGFRLCLARPPRPDELDRLVVLYESARGTFAGDPDRAKEMATNPLGPAPPGLDTAELAAWTVVGNVLLNLDETLMTR